VLVQPDLSILGYPEVFVIGDLAALADEKGKPLPGVAQVAIQEGAWAAKMIAHDLASPSPAPRSKFHYRDRGSLATIGRAAAVAQIAGLELSGYIAWLAWLFIHILFLIGFRNRIVVMVNWAWAYLTYERGARLITGRDDLPGWKHPSSSSDSQSPHNDDAPAEPVSSRTERSA
jgi:NADH dehydrogenase